MRPNRTRIAAAGTVLALGGLAAVALGSGGSTEPAAGMSATTAAPVRTEVVRRTVHVKPKNDRATAPAPADAPAAAAPAPLSVPDDHGDDDRDDHHGGGDHDDDRFDDHDEDDDDDHDEDD